MSDGSERLLSFGGVPFGARAVGDVSKYEFALTPETLPYGESRQMPADFQPFEFLNVETEPLSDIEIIEAEIQTYDWQWDEEDQNAFYTVKLVAEGITVSDDFLLTSGDRSPLIVSL